MTGRRTRQGWAIEPPLQGFELVEIFRLLAPATRYLGDRPEDWTNQTLYREIRARLAEARGGTRQDRGEAIRERDQRMAGDPGSLLGPGAHVQQTAILIDDEGIPVPVGADHDRVTIGRHRFTLEQIHDLTQSIGFAVITARIQSEEPCPGGCCLVPPE